jgi:hypothetical protein
LVLVAIALYAVSIVVSPVDEALAMLLHWTDSFLFGLIAGIPLVFGGG